MNDPVETASTRPRPATRQVRPRWKADLPERSTYFAQITMTTQAAALASARIGEARPIDEGAAGAEHGAGRQCSLHLAVQARPQVGARHRPDVRVAFERI